jgi:hypothetical protein
MEGFKMNLAMVENSMIQASPGVTGSCPECLGIMLPCRSPRSDDNYYFRHFVAGDCSLARSRSSGRSGENSSNAAEIPLTRVYGRGADAIYMPRVLSDRYNRLKQHIRATGDISELESWLTIGRYLFPQQSQAGRWGAMKNHLCNEHHYQMTELDRFNYLAKLTLQH